MAGDIMRLFAQTRVVSHVNHCHFLLHRWEIIHSCFRAQRFSATPGAPASGRPRPNVTVKTASTKALDINAEGEINGVPTYDFDLDNLKLDEMPWRKPGKALLFTSCFLTPYSEY